MKTAGDGRDFNAVVRQGLCKASMPQQRCNTRPHLVRCSFSNQPPPMSNATDLHVRILHQIRQTIHGEPPGTVSMIAGVASWSPALDDMI